MGTTIWVEERVRDALRDLQENLRTNSANETILRLLEQPSRGARDLFARHKAKVREVMARHRIHRLIAFGSRARGDARIDSDFDLAAEFDRGVPPLTPLAAERELEEIFGLTVNLVELPNPRLAPALEKDGVNFEFG